MGEKSINLSPTAGSTSLITGVAGAIASNNSAGFRIGFTLAAGTDFHATNDTWVAGSNKMSTSNQVNGLDSTSNNFWLTGVQLEVGEYTSSTIPPFQHESWGDNLARCHRYYITYGTVGAVQDGYAGRAYSGTAMVWSVPLPRPLRASPTVTLTGTLRAFGYNATFDSTSALGVYSYANTNSNMITLNSTGFSSLANDTIYNVLPINDCFIELNAEL